MDMASTKSDATLDSKTPCAISSRHFREILTVRAHIALLQTQTLCALRKCHWPGRSHALNDDHFSNLHYFLDGAHTKKSIAVAIRWFNETVKARCDNINTLNILLFACTGGRDPCPLLKIIQVNISHLN